MADVPERLELEATVNRLLERFRASEDPVMRELLRSFSALDKRFVVDLADPRDLALARASALMMVRAQTEGWAGEADGT